MNPGTPNPTACQLARESLLEFVGLTDRAPASPVLFHCDACRVWFERALRHGSAFTSLPRMASDIAVLDGLVVAELNAGRRQERAVAAITSLKRLEVPGELEVMVRDRLAGAMRCAPDELERRVALELASGRGPRIERQVSALTRFAAPAELDARVARALTQPGQSDLPSRRWIAIAATLFVVFGAAAIVRQSGLFQHRAYELRVVYTESTASLDPQTRDLLSGFSGGWFEAPGEQR